ncbi:RES family NAD+ phosphorylase [Gluconacetobacter sacchari]
MRTDRVLYCFRIGDPMGEFPIFDSEGSRLYPGRWNTELSPVIYTSEHYSTAMLEKLVHANSVLPPNQHYIKITIPPGVSYEVFQTADYPGWDAADEMRCKRYGEKWVHDERSALLLVPSIPARIERNILVNPRHPDAGMITFDLPEPIWWDGRLYA